MLKRSTQTYSNAIRSHRCTNEATSRKLRQLTNNRLEVGKMNKFHQVCDKSSRTKRNMQASNKVLTSETN